MTVKPVSEQVSKLLDEKDLIPHSYHTRSIITGFR